MSKIGHLQNCLEEIFDEFTPKFVNKMHWIQLQYSVEKNKRILVLVRVYRKESEKETMKSAMYVTQIEHLDFLQAYLAGLSLTLLLKFRNDGEMKNFYFGCFMNTTKGCLKRESNQIYVFVFCRNCGR